MDGDDMQVVATLGQPVEAALIQAMLGAEGIESYLEGEHTVAANPLLSNAIGGIRVLVSGSDVARASALLAENSRAKAEAETAAAKTCPQCGQANGIAVQHPTWLAVLAVLTLGAFCLLYPWPRYKCPDCQHTWR